MDTDTATKGAYAGKVEISYLKHHLTVRLDRKGSLIAVEKAVANGTKLTVRFDGNVVLDALARVVRVG